VTGPRGLAAIGRDDPERVALVCGATRTTFSDLDRATNATAHALASAGTGPGDRVAVILGNGPEIFAAWYGYKRPRAVEFVDLRPRQANGKVVKARLRAERTEPATAGRHGEG
jgi:acyl-CoA synthetase (AMP-forming)/AMP-acid ligase II